MRPKRTLCQLLTSRRLLTLVLLAAKAKLQERERLQRQHAATSSAQHANANGKRPLTVVPADSTSPTAPGRRHEPSLARTAAVSNASNALQGALGAGPSNNQPNQRHFGGADGKGGGPDNAPLKSMIGQYVEYDLSTLKNSRGGFLLESEEDDPKRLRERQMQEELRLKRLENARLQGQLRGAGEPNTPASVILSKGAQPPESWTESILRRGCSQPCPSIRARTRPASTAARPTSTINSAPCSESCAVPTARRNGPRCTRS